MAEVLQSVWRGDECLLESSSEEERKALIAGLSEEKRVGIEVRRVGWKSEYARSRTLINGWLRRDPTHDGGGVKIKLSCWNRDVEAAMADIKETWRLMRFEEPEYKWNNRHHELTLVFRPKEENV